VKRLLVVLALAVGAVGCGDSQKELPPTQDKDAIKKEQERLKNSP
jgi:hypothetical protein